MSETTGRCQCGALRYGFDGAPSWQGYCHCESCRRATAAPVAAYLGVPGGQWRWTQGVPRAWSSSPGVEWLFCGTCGAHVAYLSEKFGGEIHFFAASLDRPEAFRPESHVFFEEHLPWLKIEDSLPRSSGSVIPTAG
jgi:hypothetical protein